MIVVTITTATTVIIVIVTCAWLPLVTAICALISTACSWMTGLSDWTPLSTASAAASLLSLTSKEASTRAKEAGWNCLQHHKTRTL